MVGQIYGWKRFWCSRSSQFDLSDRGYLTDPDSDWGRYCNSTLISLDAMAEMRCLVLLGEPGMGKSKELENLRTHTRSIANPCDQLLPIDLRAYSSEDRLIRGLFESRVFLEWLNGTHQLHLFLDSLDEGLLKIEALSILLIEELSREEYCKHLDRLHFRIACRTAVFPKGLEEGLERLWEKDVQVYELVPLRRIDVGVAAAARNLDSSSFLAAVEQKGVVPFAIKPVTLAFLIRIFQKNNEQFPQELTDLYLQGCRILCEEQRDQDYHPGTRTNRTDVESRLIVAARIAAVTVFARKSSIWTGNLSEADDEDILLEQLCLGSETVNQKTIAVTNLIVREVLDTGLFSSRGESRIGWAHQSYAEFLAAWYLAQHGLSLDQMLSLMTLSDKRVIPQLHETSGWLASLDPQVFQSLIETDPDVLVQSEITVENPSTKRDVLESLLTLYNRDKLAYRPYLPKFSPYKRWNYAGLALLLRAYIEDSSKSELSRVVAIEIAEACEVQAVQDCLANVALDSQQSYRVRTEALQALESLADDSTKARLIPLAIARSPDDLDDELKGRSLRMVYPNHLTAIGVLESLTQPQSNIIGGVYQDFLAKEFAESLQTTDLLAALTWLGEQPALCDAKYPFNRLSDRILFNAWQRLEDQAILEGFAKIVLLRIQEYKQVIDNITGIEFIELLAADDTKRRRLLEAIIALIPNSEEPPRFLAGTSIYSRVTPLKQDFDWLIEKIQNSELERVQKIYAWLVRLKLDWSNTAQISEVIRASETLPALRAEFSFFLAAVELNSLEAEAAKAEYLREQSATCAEKSAIFTLEPSPQERVLIQLAEFERGQIEAWWRLCREMTLTPTSQHYGNEWASDITSLPGWKEADDSTQQRIVAAAKQYIIGVDPETDTWFGTNSFQSLVLAGYKALRLILEKEPDHIQHISAEVWRKWTGIILDYPNASDSRNKEHREPLLSFAYQNAPDEFINRLLILLDQENVQHGDIYIVNQVAYIRDDQLQSVLVHKLQDDRLTAKSVKTLLKLLLAKKVEAAKAFAKAQISTPPPTVGKAREIAIVAAAVLMLYGNNESWSLVWQAIQSDTEYAKAVLESVTFANAFQGNIESRLREDYIADLYLYLVEHYPDPQPQATTEDTELEGLEAYSIEAEDSIRMWKNYIPARLQQRGTPEACEALRRIMRELPAQKDLLKWRLLEAEITARRKSWNPPQPEEILQLVADHDRRLVQNGQQLLKVLIESLQRLELELQGETPAARDLWDKTQARAQVFKPIDENAFSDYVKRFFDRDLKSRGIIVNREVELRRNYGSNIGERTDIHVDAVLKRPNGEIYDSITVIIEVKGCWHRDIQTAMQNQLAERYLADNACSHGLYLIGWFSCKQWDDRDTRKKHAPKISLEIAKEQFKAQAENLSSSNKSVCAYVLNTALR
ncbi:NACHT domain-containing protein [Leptolyngbya sp. NIES-2104]|uniref:NACHT domain-containing protein n=1 Tax=Leptolyngbya sp. NIES-2104 TaxID=1552121 RepID=UPI0006EC93A7|nr:hypothetical protein [Leptolyngbya sp. NIES-2104]GAP99541.1 hypothetical protein NIES2104_61070 [Leptolyngbya sp. NIES-2104]